MGVGVGGPPSDSSLQGLEAVPFYLGNSGQGGLSAASGVGKHGRASPRTYSFRNQVITELWAVGLLGQLGAAGESREGEVQAGCKETSWATPRRPILTGQWESC